MKTGDKISIGYYSNLSLEKYSQCDVFKFHLNPTVKRKANSSSSDNSSTLFTANVFEKSQVFRKKPSKKAQNLIESSSLWNSDITEENILNTKRRTRANKV